MTHIQAETLQQYLAGEVSRLDAQQIDEHLAACTMCSNLLANLAADDTSLTQMLQLDADEMAWATGTDLTGAVMGSIRRPVWSHQVLIPTILLVIGCAWGLQIGVDLVGQVFAGKGWVGITTNLLPLLLGLFWEALLYIAEGGLLVSIWPVLALGLIVWLLRLKRMEGTHYASRMG